MTKIFAFFVFLTLGISYGFDPEDHKNWKRLPNLICGEVSSDRIIGGVEAPMNGYPWIARIGYALPGRKEVVFRCGGSVVTSKVVVTAAHCVTNLENGMKVKLLETSELLIFKHLYEKNDRRAVIRLGEHDTKTNPDCDGDFCADPVVDFFPSKILIPKEYNTPPLKHDIALIQLKGKIKFTAFVRPICLGGKEFIKENFVGTVTEVAGWGIYDIDLFVESTKLQYVKLPVVDTEECKQHFPPYLQLGPTQMCVGGIIGMDSCGGDSGGPLMKVDNGPNGPRYYLLGLVSFGSNKCGKTIMPGIYTRMSEYTKWLLDNLEEKTSDSNEV